MPGAEVVDFANETIKYADRWLVITETLRACIFAAADPIGRRERSICGKIWRAINR